MVSCNFGPSRLSTTGTEARGHRRAATATFGRPYVNFSVAPRANDETEARGVWRFPVLHSLSLDNYRTRRARDRR
jgi:hypothetical protein